MPCKTYLISNIFRYLPWFMSELNTGNGKVEPGVRCCQQSCLVTCLAPFPRANFSKWLTMLEAPSVHPSR